MVSASVQLLQLRAHTYGLRYQLRQYILLVVLWYCGDDGCEGRLRAEEVLFGHLASQVVEIKILLVRFAILLGLIILYQGAGYVGATSHVSFIL
jgi:hypothetical protein